MLDELPKLVVLVALIAASFSLSTVLWSGAGLLRIVAARVWQRDGARHSSAGGGAGSGERRAPRRLEPSDVAVLIAAHNEELVIGDTIRSAAAQVPAANIFVASDGSTDGTVALAEAAGVQVIDIFPNRGKAGALVEGISRFSLRDRFQVVLLLDADSRLRPDYLLTGLPLFDDAGTVAVAGRATSALHPRPETWLGRLLTAYRERTYVFVQCMQKFGQASRRANAVAIVPGFASMYRTSILDSVDIDAAGLAIEDYNMTFEVHAKRLGRIAFHPSCAVAETQDPDTLRDYVLQMRRWSLGFWQTVRRHGAHVGVFWFSVGVSIVEVLVTSIILVLALPMLLLSTLAWLLADVARLGGAGFEWAVAIAGAVPPVIVLLGLLIPDLCVTLIAAVLSRRLPHASAICFPLLRIVDAAVCMLTLVRAFGSAGDGRWISPTRRSTPAIEGRGVDPTPDPTPDSDPDSDLAPDRAVAEVVRRAAT
ncbi:glycosyl transferase [Pseudoclavibacter sp. RFBG4]|uniref:glycosyltransferase family 2 protein n=1 Tax=Pseudoclavibacter sp. RFBG4 TaxID=2080575 RepID=UPI000CE732B8|nr:glycosyltransferase family 2 protein [Pseudoclavibacter sp. RFBG4]PPG25882.1 glycosyl transferase [Pseudoclavibacter sp. RFBG4]